MKNYTFDDCIDYAMKHNIAFNFYYCDNLHYLYADISDGADGYLTATQAIFEYNNFTKMYEPYMNLNVRYAYNKDYELMHRLTIAINKHRRTTLANCKASWNDGIMHWFGNGAFTHSHINAAYVRSAFVHGDGVWRNA